MTTELPLDEWFEDPHFEEYTPFTVSADNKRVFGHAGRWGECHLSFPNACTTMPKEEAHSYYRIGEVVTASGNTVPVGIVAMNTGHAPTLGVSPADAQAHYDNTGTIAALVASGNDKFGIWLAGIPSPKLSAEDLMLLRAARMSGDWRRIGGQLRLVGMLAVNVPGFPVPRMKTGIEQGRQLSLVAAGMMPSQERLEQMRQQAAIDGMKLKLQQRLGLDPASMVASLRKRVLGD